MLPSLDTLGLFAVALLCAWGWQRACARVEVLRTDAADHAAEVADLREDIAVARKHATDAELACELLRQSLMRGSAVLEIERHTDHRQADRHVTVAILAGQPHAFTDSVLPRARELHAHLVATGQIKPHS